MAKRYSHEEIVERMKFLANPNPKNLNESKGKDNSLLYWESAADKRKYGIVKENSKYFIKTTTRQINEGLDSTDFVFIGGLQNKLDYRYNSYSEALKNLKMKVSSINEAIDKKYKSSSWDYTKKLIQEGVHKELKEDEIEASVELKDKEAEPEMESEPEAEPEMESEPETEPEMESEP
ncbi:MAG: hypothetical protein ACOC33_03065, partial [bacterium]